MVSIITKVKFNNYLRLLNQTYLISTSENVDQINIIKQQNVKFLETGVNHQQKLKETTRTLTTFNHSVTAVSKNERSEFMAVFPDVVRDLTEFTYKYDSVEGSKWFAKSLQYNVPKGKQIRGRTTVAMYKSLVDKNGLTPENLRLIQYLGWCLELIQGMFFVTDDIMDGSVTRRGQPCWHKLENVGLTALNDALLIENSVFYIFKKYFSQKPCYTALCELFHELLFISAFGQLLDAQAANKSVKEFTMETFQTIVPNKTSFFTFYMPFAIAMHMAGLDDQEKFRRAKTIFLKMGEFYQVQNDFLDCYGDPANTGKIGTDIEKNKCTWLAVVCMQRANEEQKRIMVESYGKNDFDQVAKVKELYNELGLRDAYAEYKEDSLNMIKTLFEQTSIGLSHETFYKILDDHTIC